MTAVSTLLATLNPRERLLVMGGAALLIVLAGWVYLWQPLVAARAAEAERIARYMAVIEITRDADTRAPVVAVAPASSLPLAARVTQSAETEGIPLARLDPEGPRLRVTVAAADFARVTRWIATLETVEGMRTVSVDMSRLTAPGQVSLRLTLEDAQ